MTDNDLEMLTLDWRDIEPMQDIFRKYHDQEVDLADAAIVQLAERHNINTIFTLDRRHFRLYVRDSGNAFRLLPDDING